MKLSVLDQSPVRSGQTKASAIRETITLAKAVEHAGYHRFWVAEHHNSPSFAGTTPLLLAMSILDTTSALRVGTGGVLLALHDTEHTAEAFEVLAALHPGRVDMGIGRSGSSGKDSFTDKVLRLHQLMRMLPRDPARDDIDVWLLGAGHGSAPLASTLGAGYAHAHFLNPESGKTAIAHYRDSFRQGPHRLAPEPMAAVRVIAAESRSEAHRLAKSVFLWRTRKDLGRDMPFPDYSESGAEKWTPEELRRRYRKDPRLIVGNPEEVATELCRLGDELGVNEVMISTPLPLLEDRIRSFELVADQLARQRISSGAR